MSRKRSILVRVLKNGISRRYIARPMGEQVAGEGLKCGVYDQREQRFLEAREIGRIDPDELMRLP